ncbi:rab proteins geranylgeranyltransferase component A 1 [Entelurus aequoreus]|uniref:rab proteins geranylgeranyltransferase component A 1 n=1 Tax=Entelurus aequoreus TaxID=161455 RepID=UPI002B1E7CA8|nr:rab proteins geranylgeranyltransferase component A 1 [Entelurus aequoreus]
MAAENLPSEFDVVILGTGLTESVVAAACSRVGQRVLHLDTRSYYAARWASFTFNALLTWIKQYQEQSQTDEVQDWSSLLEEGEEPIYVSNPDSASITNLQVFCFTSEDSEDEEDEDEKKTTEEESCAGSEETPQPTEEEAVHTEKEQPELPRPLDAASQSTPSKKITFAQLVKEGRRFNIDLVSKLMYARGSLVDLLIKSNVSRYAEFKNVTRILTYRRGNVEQVPCSRADVFASRELSVVEKRKLMRFLTSCMEETEEREDGARTYSEFLQQRQLGDNLEHFLLHSIAMVTEDTPADEGLAATRHFLRCLGRYGNTPFLFPVYGLGEIPQCFCRMCAVFGGIYCLRHPVSCLLLDKTANRCKAVIDSHGQRISGSHFVLEDNYLSADFKRMATPTRCISRAVLITDRSILPSDSEQQVSVVTVPPMEAGRPAVRMVELCPSTMTCMPGTHLVHLTCQSLGSAYEDLSPVVTRMFRTPESNEHVSTEESPSVLWCLYFNMDNGCDVEVEGQQLPSNVYLCSGPDDALGHEHAIRQAESIFHKIVPEEDFCPPAPNPEDIVYDGDNTVADQEDEEAEKREEDEEAEKREEDEEAEKREEDEEAEKREEDEGTEKREEENEVEEQKLHEE